MCDTCVKAPLDRLYDASRAAMAKLYPEHAAQIEVGKHDRIAEIFAADAMSEKGQSSLPHRLDDDKLAAILDEHLATLFDGLSASMIAFYKAKLDATRR